MRHIVGKKHGVLIEYIYLYPTYISRIIHHAIFVGPMNTC
jgi:hypothetical protein